MFFYFTSVYENPTMQLADFHTQEALRLHLVFTTTSKARSHVVERFSAEFDF